MLDGGQRAAMDKEKECIGDVLVAALYADHKGWCWRPFNRFTGDSIKVNGKWEPIEPFEDTLYGRRQLDVLVAHFCMNVEYSVFDDVYVLRGYSIVPTLAGQEEKDIVTVSVNTHPTGGHYHELQIKFVKKNLRKIYKAINHKPL